MKPTLRLLYISCIGYCMCIYVCKCTAPLRCSQNKAWTSRPHGSGFVSVASHDIMREMKATSCLTFS